MISDIFLNCWKTLKPYVLVLKHSKNRNGCTMGDQQRSLFITGTFND
nr:MAG TPA: hypothetical protein [Caudoviricetes sp.]DAS30824.1 MAG TPA: hypothetical protein [Caudoviricetes sp.]DAW11227.1 MAG TPA: hypothetical protein [Caudoviricetes sp.]